MRLKNFFKGLFIFGLILFLGVICPAGNVHIAFADETQDIKLNVNSQTIIKGKSFSLYVYNLSEGQEVTFISSEPAIASVNEIGLVTGNNIGTTTILVTVTEGENTIDILSCDIKVGPPAISVQFSRLELALAVGEKVTLERIILPLNTVETAKFSSSDRAVATVSAGGRVTAKAEGFTYIFAQLDNGSFAVCKVNVFPEILTEETETTDTESVDTVQPSLTEDIVAEPLAKENSVTEPSKELSSEESSAQAAPVNSDPLPENNEEMDFDTFIKNLNADGKSAENAESTTGDAN